MKNGRFQAKDIDDVFFLACVDWASMEPRPPVPWASKDHGAYENFPHWVLIWNLECMMPLFPTEVIRAKASTLIRRRLLTGCDCGCRGDFELTVEGAKFLLEAGQPLAQVVEETVARASGETIH